MVVMTDDPEECADALNTETVSVPKLRPAEPMTIALLPLPPASAWDDTDQLVRVRALPRNEPLTAAKLRGYGVRFHELPFGGSP
jgi:hypothetical protein